MPGAQTVQEMTHGGAILISHWSRARELGIAQVRKSKSQSYLEAARECGSDSEESDEDIDQ